MKKLAFLLIFLVGCLGIMCPDALVLVQATMTKTIWGVSIEGWIDNIGDTDTNVKVIAELYNRDKLDVKLVATDYRTMFIYSGEHKYFNVPLFYKGEFTTYKVRLKY